MREPDEHEAAYFLSKGDAGVLADALAVYLMQELKAFRREQAHDLRGAFLRQSREG